MEFKHLFQHKESVARLCHETSEKLLSANEYDANLAQLIHLGVVMYVQFILLHICSNKCDSNTTGTIRSPPSTLTPMLM